MPATQTSIHVDPKWYQVMSAMRGCDYTTGPIADYLCTVKHEVTTRIRYIVFNTTYLNGANIRSKSMDEAEITRLIATLDFLTSMDKDDMTPHDARNVEHFIMHLYQAMATVNVQNHEVWGDNGRQVYLALRKCSNRLFDKWA